MPRGNTPTCVGKTEENVHDAVHRKKHPHMRGEDDLSTQNVGDWGETPPHAWGRPMTAPRSLQGSGNTPTCVGKTNTFWQVWNAERKHPHMRGEDNIAMSFVLPQIETPPHAWGRHAKVSLERPKKGNTPTCVGKTEVSACTKASWWKHPHMRGEDRNAPQKVRAKLETPPHAWGRPTRPKLCGPCARNTPTCVGKTPRKIQSLDGRRKHPHMRGEDAITSAHVPVWEETPPHAWGRLRLKCPDLASIRNTPTCVGKTAIHSSFNLFL